MLTDEERSTIERRLLDERARALELLGQFDESLGTSLKDQAGELGVHRLHLADIGTEAMEREKEFLLASQEGQRLYRIDAALRRLYQEPESFGQCARCGRAIGLGRLEIVPEGEFCAECQRAVEQ
jgi:DnaK suppressor protein